jgi:hypothetical protein
MVAEIKEMISLIDDSKFYLNNLYYSLKADLNNILKNL